MPVYNMQKYVSQAIDSILGQTFRDFEFIIVDDGSFDNTKEIIRKYNDRRIIIFRNRRNLGIAKSLNIGLKQSCGKYLARMDADDISLPLRLERQVSYFEKDPSLGALGASVQCIGRKGEKLFIYSPPLSHEHICSRLLLNNYLRHPTMMFRRSCIDKAGRYPVKYRYAEDYYLFWKLSFFTKIENLKEVMLLYRLTDESIRVRHHSLQLKSAFEISFKAVSGMFKSQKISKNSFKRFWIDYYKRDGCLRKKQKLKIKDIDRLKPFWVFLRDHSVNYEVWRADLLDFSERLARYNPKKGLYLKNQLVSKLKYEYS